MPSPTNMDNHSTKHKVGPDGLTRSQRYYRKHPEVKVKNRERERLRRERKKLEKQLASTTTKSSNVEAAVVADGAVSTSGLVITPVPVVPPCPSTPKGPSAISSKVEAAVIAVGAVSTSVLLTVPVPITTPCPPTLEGPFVHTSGSSSSPAPPSPKPVAIPREKIPFLRSLTDENPSYEDVYGDALNVLAVNHMISRDGKRETLLEKVDRITYDAHTWCSWWGGVSFWHISLCKSYKAAHEGFRTVEWENELLEHASYGRHLLYQLTSTVELLAERSPKPHKLKEIFRVSMETMQMLTMGLTVLNMRCSVLPSNTWKVQVVPSSSPSSEEGPMSFSSGEDESSRGSDWGAFC